MAIRYPQAGGTESRKPYAQGMLGTHPRTIALKATWLRIKETAAKESRRENQHSGQLCVCVCFPSSLFPHCSLYPNDTVVLPLQTALLSLRHLYKRTL